MYSGVSQNPTRDYISLYNNVGFISKGSENAATESTENRVSDHPTVV